MSLGADNGNMMRNPARGCIILIHVVCKCLMIRLDSQLIHVLRGTDLIVFCLEAMTI